MFAKSGLNDRGQQLVAAVDIVYWMQTMLPKIMAHTADVWHVEHLRLLKSRDAQERNAGFASLVRMLLAVRHVGELDGAEVASFSAPKVIVSGDSSTIIQPIAHERTIADGMLLELRRGKSTTQKLAEIAAAQPLYDLDGTATRALMDVELAAFRQSLEEAEQKGASLHEKLYYPWARYSIWMAGTKN